MTRSLEPTLEYINLKTFFPLRTAHYENLGDGKRFRTETHSQTIISGRPSQLFRLCPESLRFRWVSMPLWMRTGSPRMHGCSLIQT